MLLAVTETDTATILAAHVDALSRWSSPVPRYDPPEDSHPHPAATIRENL